MKGDFHQMLKMKIHGLIVFVYKAIKIFPRSELYGITSQLTRASMSIMLNYVEGYARRRDKVKLNFYETAHGSTQEVKYLLYFTYTQNWINDIDYKYYLNQVDEIAKMLWSTIEGLERKIGTV